MFNGTNCVACPNGTYYLLSKDTCLIPQFVSNINALNKTNLVVNIGNHTLSNLSANISAIKVPIAPCPSSTPLFNGTACINCPNGTYFLLLNKTCYTPGFVPNFSSLSKLKNYVNVGNHTLASLNASAKASKFPVKSCPHAFPVWNGTNCIVCPNGTYYLLNNFTCYTPKNVTNVAYLNKTQSFFNLGNATLSALNSSINSSKLPVTPCNSSVPFFNGTSCMACPNGTFYLLGRSNISNSSTICMKPVFVTNTLAVANSSYGKGNFSLGNITNSQKLLSLKQKVISCPIATPLALKNGTCVGCNSSTHFVDLQTMSCNKSVTISNFPILKKARIIQIGTANLTNL